MNLKKLNLYVKPIKVNAIQCQDCKDTIFSRANHDCRHCSCGKIYIDGGFNEHGGMGMTDKQPLYVQITVDASKAELYDDWNKSIDKYGRIPNEKIPRVRRRNRRSVSR